MILNHLDNMNLNSMIRKMKLLKAPICNVITFFSFQNDK